MTGKSLLNIASRVGLAIDAESVRVLPESAEICRRLDIDPWGLIASGALIICAAPESADHVVGKLGEAGIDAAVIGRTTQAADGLKLAERGEARELPSFERDEAARVLGG